MTSMLDKLGALVPAVATDAPTKPPMSAVFAPPGVKPEAWQVATAAPQHLTTGRIRHGVKESDDLARILAVPRRRQLELDAPPDSPEGLRVEALVELMTSRLARVRAPDEPCACASMGRACITRLKPAQAWALYEAPLAGGIVAPIGVGHGKTGLDILMPMVMRRPDGSPVRLAVLLVPPGLRDQLLRDYMAWREHFHVPSLVLEEKGHILPGRPVLHVVPFSRLSRAGATDLLDQLAPDLVIVDEAHKLRHRNTATTGRVLRRFARNPATRLCVWSGTLTAKSIKDYAHLSAFALGESSPLPLDPSTVEEWALAIDPSDWPAPLEALANLCEPGEHIHHAFHRRLVETRGVVATRVGAVDASINIMERKAPPVPPDVAEMLRKLRDGDAENGWVRPDGEELVDIFAVTACARQLACGFFYRWKFPRGEAPEMIDEWFAARKAWNKEVRKMLLRRVEHLDSPLLLQNAAERALAVQAGRRVDPHLPTWDSETWRRWRDVKDTVYHESEAVWVSDYLVNDAAEWATKHRGIVWFEHNAFGERVGARAGLPVHGGGLDAEARILAEKGDRSIIASIKAHGTGRDGLQRIFREQLVANPPASGDAWEQLLGRLHRIGQEADEVDTFVYRHTVEMRDAIDKAVRLAKYIEGTMGTSQKLLAATVTFPIDLDDF